MAGAADSRQVEVGWAVSGGMRQSVRRPGSVSRHWGGLRIASTGVKWDCGQIEWEPMRRMRHFFKMPNVGCQMPNGGDVRNVERGT